MSRKEKPKILVKIFFLLYSIYSEVLVLIYKVLKKPLIYVIGDSHTFSFLLHLPFIVKHLGSATAYGLGNKNKNYYKLERLLKRVDINKDIILLSFGEIDSRIHLFTQLKMRSNKPFLIEIINEVIAKYGRVLLNLKIKGYTLYIYGIPPASSLVENTYNYIHYGTPAQRSIISIILNVNLEGFCTKNNISYINIQKVTSTPEGFIKSEYTKDKLHLNNKIVPVVRSIINGTISN